MATSTSLRLIGRSTDGKPAYRGGLAELGTGIRGLDDRLAVRPDSAVLANAVRDGQPPTAAPP